MKFSKLKKPFAYLVMWIGISLLIDILITLVCYMNMIEYHTKEPQLILTCLLSVVLFYLLFKLFDWSYNVVFDKGESLKTQEKDRWNN